MKNVHIPGAVTNVGAGQGYEGISVLYTTEEVLGRPNIPVYKVAYKLEPHEIQALSEGAKLVLTVVGSPPIMPHRLEVGSS